MKPTYRIDPAAIDAAMLPFYAEQESITRAAVRDYFARLERVLQVLVAHWRPEWGEPTMYWRGNTFLGLGRDVGIGAVGELLVPAAIADGAVIAYGSRERSDGHERFGT